MSTKDSNHTKRFSKEHTNKRKPVPLSDALRTLCIAMKNKNLFEKDSLMDSNLLTVDSNKKNPIIFPKDMQKYLSIKSNSTRDTYFNFNQSSKNKHTSCNEVIKENFLSSESFRKKETSKGILRWDSVSFSNKSVVFKKELKNIDKNLKNKKVIKKIKEYQKIQMKKHDNLNDTSNKITSLKDVSEYQRKDMFGNLIKKGGGLYKVSFSSIGDMNLVENWKVYNKRYLPRRVSSNDKKRKKKCSIF